MGSQPSSTRVPQLLRSATRTCFVRSDGEHFSVDQVVQRLKDRAQVKAPKAMPFKLTVLPGGVKAPRRVFREPMVFE